MTEAVKDMTQTMQELVEAIENRLYGTGITVVPQEVTKNNGTKHNAIMVDDGGDALKKLVYVDEILGMLDSGEIDAEEAAEEFEEAYRRTGKDDRPECVKELAGILTNWDAERIMEHVKPILVNAEWNKAKESYATTDFLDLAIQYEVRVEEARAILTKDVVERLGGLEIVESTAARNAESDGFEMTPMSEIIGTMQNEVPMYVVTNPMKLHGAVAMIFGEVFEKLATEMDSDLYIIPSSVHEIIAVPVQEGDTGSLCSMIQSVNCTLDETEKLSDHPYIYRRGSMQVAIA